MLSDHVQPGVLLVGLAQLINSGRPGMTGSYRVVPIGAQTAIEFFEDNHADQAVKILPYRPGRIASIGIGANEEVISGEFTGCIMSLYREGGTLKVGHVDTNRDTSQRDDYDGQRTSGAITVVDEYDSTGKLGAYPQTTGATKILCIASSARVRHYFVDGELHQHHGMVPVPGGGGTTFGPISGRRYKVLHAHGH